MAKHNHYLDDGLGDSVIKILNGIDQDVERGEDALMLGLCIVMLSSTFAPVAPPFVLLPLVALTFAFSAGYARINYHNMERKLLRSIARLDWHEQVLLSPIVAVFRDYPMESLTVSFNPLKNLKRTWKSALGGIFINPFWMPIFYVMGMQIVEEKNLCFLNRAIICIEQKTS